MQELWQNAVVLAVVALAAAYLTYRAVGVFRRKKAAGCGGGCHGCAATESSSPKLVSIGLDSSNSLPSNDRQHRFGRGGK